jgi:eukaryotic-like serine/threonine-protein kinase
MPTEPPHDDAGRPLPPRYRDPVRVAVGGMGTVHRAEDERLGRTVAVKVMSSAFAADEVFRRRFAREAAAAARIHHPHVATIYDVGEHDGLPYLVMEWVPGGTLAARLEGGRPPREQALDWIAQAAEALDAAHAAGVVHRDVKPANLLLDARDRVKVADFGIARVLGDSGLSLTATGMVLGTSGYSSPEQALGIEATPLSDVYSFAAVAFELLTGERPYAGRSGLAELTAHVREPVPRASDRAPELPPPVDAALARGLAKEPEDRPASAGALADALRAAAAVPIAPLSPPARRRRRGGGAARAAVAVALAAAVLGGATAAALVAGGDDEEGGTTAAEVTAATTAPAPTTVVRTVTAPAPAPVTVPAPPSVDEAVALTDRSTAALEDGDSATGLALADEALLALAGTGLRYEGNAAYNSGRALIDLDRCEEAVARLERSVAVGGSEWQMGVRRAALAEAREC